MLQAETHAHSSAITLSAQRTGRRYETPPSALQFFLVPRMLLSTANAGLHPSQTRRQTGQAGRPANPVSVQMRPLNEQGSDEMFADLNPVSQRGKVGGGAAAGSSRSRTQVRGGRESPDAVEMQLAVGGAGSGEGASAQVDEDDFADFVSAEEAPAAGAITSFNLFEPNCHICRLTCLFAFRRQR
jgi:hypothetical protein